MSNSDINFSDGVRHLYLHSINCTTKINDTGLRTWLQSSDNYLVLNQPSVDSFELSFYDFEEILSCWASDINRLSCASFETVCNLVESTKNKKFLAWNLIDYYYSAFYSAHSILKVLGFGLIQIDDCIIRKICNKANAFGIPIMPIQKGIYCTDFSAKRGSVIFYKVKKYDDSHKGLWMRFVDLLNVLTGFSVSNKSYDNSCITIRKSGEAHPESIYFNLPINDANNIVQRIDEIKAVLNKNGNYNWLSSVRNTLNYNHSYGVWYPYRSYINSYDKIVSLQKLCYLNPMDSVFDNTNADELVVYVKTCQLINAINYDILNDLRTRHPENKSFLDKGLFSYIKLYGNKT